MARTIITAPGIFVPPPAYSHAVKAAGLVFVSGIGAFDAHGTIIGETAAEQVAQALRNISAILAAAGTSLSNAVSATLLLADAADFPAANAEWLAWFPVDPPSRKVVQLGARVANLKVSIELIAAV